MAHFTDGAGARISLSTVRLKVGETKQIGLWGFRDFQGAPLTVSVDTPDGMRCSGIAATRLLREAGDMRFYQLRGWQKGSGRVDALTVAGHMWDKFDLVVDGEMRPIDRLVQALDDRTLTMGAGDAAFIREVARGSTTRALDPQIAALMDSLLSVGPLDVMSLIRPGQSQHGVVSGGMTTCKAIDIAGFNGRRVTLSPKPAAIQTVASILERFPEGQFDIGFPRPVGGANGFSPSDDVFFAVPDQATAQLCWDGHISRPLSAMMQPAQNDVRAAMARSRAAFNTLYPDGLNHLHVSVTKTPR